MCIGGIHNLTFGEGDGRVGRGGECGLPSPGVGLKVQFEPVGLVVRSGRVFVDPGDLYFVRQVGADEAVIEAQGRALFILEIGPSDALVLAMTALGPAVHQVVAEQDAAVIVVFFANHLGILLGLGREIAVAHDDAGLRHGHLLIRTPGRTSTDAPLARQV